MESLKFKDFNGIEQCAEIIKSGGLVAFPTETVYGLGADATNPDAVQKIFDVKMRPANNPLIAHINDVSMLERIAKNIPENIFCLFEAYWPGALTVVLPKKDVIPDIVTAKGNTVAVRCPSHPVANKLIALAGVPIVAPSANISGKPSPTKFEHVKADLDGKIDAMIDGGSCEIGIESTVVIPMGERSLRLLRPGAITPQMLENKGFEVEIDKHILTPVAEGTCVASPGMLYKHYAPKAKMVLVRGQDEKVIEYIRLKSKESNIGVLCFDGESKLFDCTAIEYGVPDNPLTLSAKLFDALREFDKTQVNIIYARVADPYGVGLGIYNRMLRAAAFNVIAL